MIRAMGRRRHVELVLLFVHREADGVPHGDPMRHGIEVADHRHHVHLGHRQVEALLIARDATVGDARTIAEVLSEVQETQERE